MTAEWKEARARRRDRYQDWAYRRRGMKDNRWCGVFVDVRGTPADNRDAGFDAKIFRQNLFDMRSRAQGNTTDGATALPELHVSADELEALTLTIDGIDKVLPENPDGEPGSPEDLPSLTHGYRRLYFVYIREDDIFGDEGNYRLWPQFDILHASPPIEGLNPGTQVGRSSDYEKDAGVVRRVAMAIIDDGLAFANSCFDQHGFEHVWIQRPPRKPSDRHDPSVFFGWRIDRKAIEQAKKGAYTDRAVYRKQIGRFFSQAPLDYSRPEHQPLSYALSHGTLVADLALRAFQEKSEGPLSLYGVQLPTEVTEDTSGSSLAFYFLAAVWQVFRWADRWFEDPLPLVINFSYGFSAGPKDGEHVIERLLDKFVDLRQLYGSILPGDVDLTTYVVMPIGNSHRDRETAMLTRDDKEHSLSIDWMVLPDDKTSSFVEIWSDVPVSSLSFTLTPPRLLPASPSPLNPGRMLELCDSGKILAAIYADDQPTLKGRPRGAWRSRIMIALAPSAGSGNAPHVPHGAWRLDLGVPAEGANVLMHVQRDDTPSGYPVKGRQSYFAHELAFSRKPDDGSRTSLSSAGPVTHKHTMSAIANGDHVTVVGAARLTETAPVKGKASYYSSSGGYKIAGLKKGPNFSAIADGGWARWGVYGAGTYSDVRERMAGSSIAAPQVAGDLAAKLSAFNTPNPRKPPMTNREGELIVVRNVIEKR